VKPGAQEPIAKATERISATAIARILSVIDKTVTKAIDRARRDASNPSL